ncbi:MAG: glycosyltransferase [Desulfobacteraceae bacterium]|nr:glycosyltransferase [Desulfobacteraceae bacterium]
MTLPTIPTITVITAVYNCEKYVRESIDSTLQQTFPDFELILIDDGSTDGTLEILERYRDERITLIHQSNMGLAKSLNKGLWTARGKYIVRLDADDISMPHRFERQYRFMEDHPECVISGASAMMIDADGKYLYTETMPTSWSDTRRYLPYESPFFHSAVIFRREPALACGGYYEKIKHHFEDLFLWNKLAAVGELRNLEEPLIKYRLVPFAITNNSMRLQMGKIVQKALAGEELTQEELQNFANFSRKESANSRMSNYYLRIGSIYLSKRNEQREAIKNFLKSVAYYPPNHRAWFFLFLSALSCIHPKIFSAWKQFRQSGT